MAAGGLPVDVFSGKVFEYIKRYDCFVLKFSGKNIGNTEVNEYEFVAK